MKKRQLIFRRRSMLHKLIHSLHLEQSLSSSILEHYSRISKPFSLFLSFKPFALVFVVQACFFFITTASIENKFQLAQPTSSHLPTDDSSNHQQTSLSISNTTITTKDTSSITLDPVSHTNNGCPPSHRGNITLKQELSRRWP